MRGFTVPAQPLRQPNQARPVLPDHSGGHERTRKCIHQLAKRSLHRLATGNHDDVGAPIDHRPDAPKRFAEPPAQPVAVHGAAQLTAGRSAQAHLSPLAEKHINGGDGGNVATPRSIDPLEVLAAGKARVCPAAPRARSPHKSPSSDGNAMSPLGPAALQYAPPAAGTHPGQEPVHPLAAALLRLIGPLHLGVCASERRVRARVTISQPPNPFNRRGFRPRASQGEQATPGSTPIAKRRSRLCG